MWIYEVKKSSHKNFVEWYGRNRNLLINEKIIPYQNGIFKLFYDKFHADAEKDWEKWKIKLKKLWNDCANFCNEIHSVLSLNKCNNMSDDLKNTVKNIINMDYESVQLFFNELKNKYEQSFEISEKLNSICKTLQEMRRISKKYTNIIDNPS